MATAATVVVPGSLVVGPAVDFAGDAVVGDALGSDGFVAARLVPVGSDQARAVLERHCWSEESHQEQRNLETAEQLRSSVLE